MISGSAKALVHLSAAAFSLGLLTGCGGGASSDPPESAETAVATATATNPPEGLTAKRLAAALPGDDSFPEGAVVLVRCPGDPPCDNKATQTQDASVSVNLPLPAGAEQDTNSFDEDAKFRVDGGEWSENLWLRAWIYRDGTTAKADVADFRKDAEKLVGNVNVPAKKIDSGYDYGIRGSGSVDTTKIGDWRGFVRVLDATFVHLDGRITDRRFNIFAVMENDNAFVRIDSSFTVQGRNKADAVRAVQDILEDYLKTL
ncbi:hypothetical protein [Aeromicrobium sp. A1-2]|uniref:hypothetical protein n=1 Tax=Aeromicrobium sp. A1-2 TaxID=2107713 RepID=UPI0013C37BAF|nr:hypothetical protein [Aeromicrobium sp. A1-2]